MTHLCWYLGAFSVTIYKTGDLLSKLVILYFFLVLGSKRQNCSLKTITCEPRSFLKRYLIKVCIDMPSDSQGVG